jgi:hypothetical protein
MPDFFLIEVSSGVIFMGQREYQVGSRKKSSVLTLDKRDIYLVHK